jgi:hypothetical protein
MSRARDIADSAATINALDGVTATGAELNILDGVTATTAELNYVDGVTSNIQTQIDNISPSPTITATASGALANGDTVIVNSDGTVSAITGSGATESLGSNQVISSDATTHVQVIYDTQNDKVIAFYKRSGDMYAKVCTVSGETITAGTEQTVYNNNGTVGHFAVTYVGSGKFVFMANDSNVNGGVSAIGSVSGTTVTMGSTVQFGDNANDVEHVSIVYDENEGKVVACWQQKVSPNQSYAAVGSISGTTLSYGTPVSVTSQRAVFYPSSTVYDSTAQKVILCYMTFSGSEYARARVGTISGTSISFGTEVTVRSAITDDLAAVYDPDNNKTILFYRDSGSGYDLRASVLTVSGTSITVGTATTITERQARNIGAVYDTNADMTVVYFRDVESGSFGRVVNVSISGTTPTNEGELYIQTIDNDNDFNQIAFDSDNNKVILASNDADNSNYPTLNTYQAPFFSSNMTAENFIGFSDAAYSDTATATIQVNGAVDDAQSGLTAGQKYFVQADGSLGLTAASVSVEAGIAISATEIIVKG